MNTPRYSTAGRRLGLAGLVIGVAVVGAVILVARSPTSDQLAESSRQALQNGQLDEAGRLLQQSLQTTPDHVESLILTAQLAERNGEPREALDALRRLPEDGPDFDSIFTHAANLAKDAAQAADVEFFLKRTLAINPEQPDAQRALAELYVCQGRRWESAEPLWQTVRLRQYTLQDLALLGNLDQLHECEALMARYRAAAPDDPVPLIGSARIALLRDQTDEAQRLLRQVIAQRPHQIEAHVRLGEILAEKGRLREFLQWHAALPATAEEHPGTWVDRAIMLQHLGLREQAVRCFWEAARRDPNHRVAHYQLAALLLSRDSREAAARFAARAERLEKLARALRYILLDGPSLKEFREAATLTEELGRPWEAWAWQSAIVTYFPNKAGEARDEAARLRQQLGPEVPRTLASAVPALAFDLSEFALPEWQAIESSIETAPSHITDDAAIHFVDAAAATGFDFQYDNGTRPDGPVRIHQVLGGGAAVVDFDLDGWPDLCMPQGGPLETEDASQRANQLFRNSGVRFENVTASAGCGDTGYGLGTTVGDYDGDGWPDLYTANAGRNRLYRNNGDGTFCDATDEAGLTAAQFTTCTLMADLNGDGLPDLFDVNYCGGADVYQRFCYDNHDPQVTRSCRPIAFEADPDRLLINRGDGRFEDVTDRIGFADTNGRGLGIVAFDTSRDGRLELFVANDMTANAFLTTLDVDKSGVPHLEDRAIVAGLAFDFDGVQQACMGVAADDANGDGTIDLFVTNFHDESNTLYRQHANESFSDSTRQAGLREASFKMLGFGTQFLDADLDGWPDLVVANGHIDDYSDRGTPYRMPAQVFRNQQGRFVEREAAELGEYFQHDRLGRGLARLDWNRDGREDVVVSHLYEPAALLTNTSRATGHYFGLRLVAVESARDAVGATVEVTLGERTVTKQVTAGDGYQCSNERRIIVGIGPTSSIADLTIYWPSGREQTWSNIPANVDFLAVEGKQLLREIATANN